MKIELKNFQAHSQTVLNLRDGLVCVVGATNAGKSSIIRALRSLIYDSIRGYRYVRHGQASATVNVQFDDVAVAKVKGKKENRYIVGGEKYDAIGVGIPVEAAKALNMPLVKVDKDLEIELHVASQLNPPFLILDNDSTRAKFLNVLTGGHILDAALRETNRKIREVDDTRKGIITRLDEAKTQLKAFEDIPAKESTLSGIKSNLERLAALEKRIEQLTLSQSVLGLIRVKQERADAQLAALSRYDWAWSLSRLSIIQQTVDSVERLSRIRHESAAVANKIKALTLHDWGQFLTRLSRISEITNCVDNTKRIRNSLQPIQHKLAYVAGIDCVMALNRLSSVASVKEIGERLKYLGQQSFGVADQEFACVRSLQDAQDAFVKLPDQPCVTCGRPIDRATREQHLRETIGAN